MTEAKLRSFEMRYRRDLKVMLTWEELQSLTAEIRRLRDALTEIENIGREPGCLAWECHLIAAAALEDTA